MKVYLKPRTLATALRDGTLHPAAEVVYLLTALIWQSLLGSPGILTNRREHWLQGVVLLGLLFAAISLLVGYRANGGTTGRNFLTRYFCLAVVVWTWLLLAWIAAYLLINLALFFAVSPSAMTEFGTSSTYWLVLLTVFYSAFVLQLRRYMLIAASPPTEPPRTAEDPPHNPSLQRTPPE